MIASASILGVEAVSVLLGMFGALCGLVVSAAAVRVLLVHREHDVVEVEIEQASGALLASRSKRAIEEAIDHQYCAAREVRRLKLQSLAFDRLLGGYVVLFGVALSVLIALAWSERASLTASTLRWFGIGLATASVIASVLFGLSRSDRIRGDAVLAGGLSELGWSSARIGRRMELAVRKWLASEGWHVSRGKPLTMFDLTADRDGEISYWVISARPLRRRRQLDAIFEAAMKHAEARDHIRPGIAVAVTESAQLSPELVEHASGQGIALYVVSGNGGVRSQQATQAAAPS